MIFNELSDKQTQQILFNEFLLNREFIGKLDEEALGFWVEFIAAYYKYIRSFKFYSNYLGKRMLMILVAKIKTFDYCCNEHIMPGSIVEPASRKNSKASMASNGQGSIEDQNIHRSTKSKCTHKKNMWLLNLFTKLFRLLIPKMGKDELFPFLEMNI